MAARISRSGRGGARGAGAALAGALVLAGCHGGAATPSSTTSTGRATPTVASADHVVGDRVTVGAKGGALTVAAVEPNVDAGRLFAPPRGQAYFAAEVSGCAGPAESGVSFRPEFFTVVLADHSIRPAGPGMKKPDLRGGTIPPGRCLDGWVTFTVSRGSVPVAVVYEGAEAIRWSVPKKP